MAHSILGLDIGGTKCSVVLGKEEDGLLQIKAKKTFPTEVTKGFAHTMHTIQQQTDAVLHEAGLTPEQIAACGISCGGPLDSDKGLVMSPPNLPGWNNIPIVEIVEKHYGIQTALQNDANASALAEWKYGAGRGCNNLIFLTFGTGMGAGLILNGRLYAGANGMAGEAGHIRLERYGPIGYGKAGSFEGFCSGGGIAQLACNKVFEKIQSGEKVSFCPTLADLSKVNARTVADAAFAGDELAKEIYHTSGHCLGKALSILIDVLNPEIIILGSIYLRAQQLIEPAMNEVIRQETLPHARQACRIVPAGLKESLGDYAALSVASFLLESEP
ncbi:MAG: ROK family protein [Tannerellaceae bacterium]|jgi:glucokinase|nr:ROK family protein [Tannerellaceae bacterium]